MAVVLTPGRSGDATTARCPLRSVGGFEGRVSISCSSGVRAVVCDTNVGEVALSPGGTAFVSVTVRVGGGASPSTSSTRVLASDTLGRTRTTSITVTVE